MIALLLAILIAIETFRRLPLIASFRTIAALGRRSTALLAHKGASDWSKGRGARILSARLFGCSLRAGLLILLIAAPVAAAIVADLLLDQRLGAVAALTDWRSRLIILAATLGYALVRHRLAKRLQPR